MDDEQRFGDLFTEHYRAIARYFLARGHAAGDADDLVAATFEVAWRRFGRLPPGEEVVPWLYGVARNHSRNARRKTRRETDFVHDMTFTAATSTELPIEDREEFAETMRALRRLKPADRELILLVAWDELTPTDAGRVLGLSSNAARTRLHRARRRLADLLEDGESDDAR